ncbi:MAG: DUF2905 domain-containing protein [Leptospiraceae bacterium]|nr:DUF2905 domain-containing protein [Leptospiraceae bacterium]MDW7975855.1 DUF2905 domain-containing protein [Leptospiraceae bacterium]
MMDLGKLFFTIGIIFIVLGLLFSLLNNESFPFRFLGNLPGDIRIEKENFKFYFPLTTSIFISLLLTLIFYLIQKFR